MEINKTIYCVSSHAKKRFVERVLKELPYRDIDLSDHGFLKLAISDCLPNVKFVWRKADGFHGFCCTTALIKTRKKRAIDPYEQYDASFADSVMEYIARRIDQGINPYTLAPEIMDKFNLYRHEASAFLRFYIGEFYL